jgi:hypothetical protein
VNTVDLESKLDALRDAYGMLEDLEQRLSAAEDGCDSLDADHREAAGVELSDSLTALATNLSQVAHEIKKRLREIERNQRGLMTQIRSARETS